MRPLSVEDVDSVRNIYTIGSRVKLVATDDQYTTLKSGDMGSVAMIDDYGTVFVDWDNGSRLGLLVGIDDFLIVERKAQ